MLGDIIQGIKSLDQEAMKLCKLRIDNLTKPLGSLSGLEYLAIKMAGVTRQVKPRKIKRSIIVVAADHGVAAEVVGDYPELITEARLVNCALGQSVINALAEHVNARLVLADIGVAVDLSSIANIYHDKISYGTGNISKGPAMSRREMQQAIECGIKIANDELDQGTRIIGLGEIGTGNTMAATAIVACYSDKTVEYLVRPDASCYKASDDATIQITNQVLAVNKPDRTDPLDVLAKVGGLEFAAMVGAILAAAAGGALIVIDGLATAAAAVIAVKLAPKVQEYLVGSHFPDEPAHAEALGIIGIEAYLHLELKVGEGAGAALGIALVDASLCMLNEMKTFGEAEVAVAQDGPGAGYQSSEIKV
ncbi:MAG: cobT 3 [Firmicutes bacterium]|nr:cobT 3 [Bacillota bacterium]